ncbi:hypothetical protein G6F62_015341 [Rhizopus arrhizus]|nr:hypothetical protein G6F62_015341 [Rhizopus arrhizus]
MSSIFLAFSSSSRSCGRASAVIAPLLSFIVAQISLIALCVPEEPSASCQPSARYLLAKGWNSRPISASAASRSGGAALLAQASAVQARPTQSASRRWTTIGDPLGFRTRQP